MPPTPPPFALPSADPLQLTAPVGPLQLAAAPLPLGQLASPTLVPLQLLSSFTFCNPSLPPQTTHSSFDNTETQSSSVCGYASAAADAHLSG